MEILETIKTANDFIFQKFGSLLLVFKILFIGLSFLFLLFIVFFTLRTKYLRFRYLEDFFEFFTYRPFGVKKIVKQWQKIKARLETGLESEYKLAVIEADSALDGVLKGMGYLGDTIEERLEKINEGIIPNLKEVKEAHSVRNKIVHDPDYKLTLEEAQKTLSIYEKALEELGAL